MNPDVALAIKLTNERIDALWGAIESCTTAIDGIIESNKKLASGLLEMLEAKAL